MAEQRSIRRIFGDPPLRRVNDQVREVRLQHDPKRIRVQRQRLILPSHEIPNGGDSEIEGGSQIVRCAAAINDIGAHAASLAHTNFTNASCARVNLCLPPGRHHMARELQG
jgi:hypothetical protein